MLFRHRDIAGRCAVSKAILTLPDPYGLCRRCRLCLALLPIYYRDGPTNFIRFFFSKPTLCSTAIVDWSPGGDKRSVEARYVTSPVPNKFIACRTPLFPFVFTGENLLSPRQRPARENQEEDLLQSPPMQATSTSPHVHKSLKATCSTLATSPARLIFSGVFAKRGFRNFQFMG